MYMNIYYFNVTNAEEVMEDLANMTGPHRIKPRSVININITGSFIVILKTEASWAVLIQRIPQEDEHQLLP